MSAIQPPPPPPGVRGEKLPIEPRWGRALLGVWLLTWRPQLTWQRLPRQLLALLVLPLVVYITLKTPDEWASRNPATGLMPTAPLNQFFKRLLKGNLALQTDQKDSLSQIFTEEYVVASAEMHAAEGETRFDNRIKRQRDASATLSEHLLTRARTVLSDAQFDKFQSFERSNRRQLDRLIDDQQEWGRTKPFYRWLVDVYFFLLLPLTCIKGCGALTRDELQADTLGFLITRPVSRARLLCVKFLSQLAWLEILLLTETLLLFAAGRGKQIPDLMRLLPIFLGAQVLAVAAWGALGTFLGQITSRYVAIALIYGAVVEMGIGRIPTNINDLSIMRHLRTLLSHNEALQNIYMWPADNPWFSVLALVIAPVLFLGVASVLFSFLEYLPASEMQK